MNDLIPRILTSYIVSELKQPLTILLVAQERLSNNPGMGNSDPHQLQLIRKNAETLNQMLDLLLDPHKIVSRFLTLNTQQLSVYQIISDHVNCLKLYYKDHPLSIEMKLLDKDNTLKGWVDQDKLSSILHNIYKVISSNYSDVVTYIRTQKINTADDVPINIHPSPEILKGDLIFSINPFPEISEDWQQDMLLSEVSEYSDAVILFFCKKIIELHNGYSFYDRNTQTFYFTIGIQKDVEFSNVSKDASDSAFPPLTEEISSDKGDIFTDEKEYTEEELDTDEKEGLTAESKFSIVVVEDDPRVRTLLKELLSDKYQVFTAVNGKEAYGLIHEMLPDLVVSDLKMPEMDGVELCSKIKSDLETSHIPVILLTAFTDIKDRIRGLKTGADHYLSKPFHSEELLLTIHNDLYNRRLLQRSFFKDASMKPEDMNLNVADKKLLDQAIQVVIKNIENPDFQVRDFADELNMATATCNRKLRAITGLTSNQFIRNIKLKEAAKMLVQGEYNIGEVAFKVGFVDQRYFSRIFKQQYRVPPREYIKKIKGDIEEDKSESYS